MLPTEVCFQIPDPGPLIINISKTDSCPDTATGSVLVTAAVPIFCSWIANGVIVTTLPICNIQSIPPGAFLQVTASNIIGCTATESITVSARAPIVLVERFRTTNGTIDGPCIDTINISISGGQLGPPYQASLFDDPTNATLTIPFGDPYTAVITNVCRSYQYQLIVTDTDNACARTIISTDPEFNVGAGNDDGVLGLPDPNNDFGVCGKKCKKKGENGNEAIWIVVAVTIMFVGVILASVIIATKQNKKK
jgi:hypothetical protein